MTRTLTTRAIPDQYLVLDIQSTGARPSRDRIIDLALTLIEDGQVRNQWHTLINPQQRVADRTIAPLGIANGDLDAAPDFASIAPLLETMLTGRVLLAHHARLQYAFLKQEFRRAGISFNARPICTLKLMRQLLPNQQDYSLNRLCSAFGIAVLQNSSATHNRDRLAELLIAIEREIPKEQLAAAYASQQRHRALPAAISKQDLDAIPDQPGVYRFYGDNDRLLYVGKSVTLRSRILSHFNQDHSDHREMRLAETVRRIEHELCLSDFSAQLLESEQIKTLSPAYNRRLRRMQTLWQVTLKPNERGYLEVSFVSAGLDQPDLIIQRYGLFRNRTQAQQRITRLIDEQGICRKTAGLEKGSKGTPCFGFQLHRCQGACCGKESPEEFNARLLAAMEKLRNQTWSWHGPVLIEEACDNAKDLHLVDQWVYYGKVRGQDMALERLIADKRPAFDLDSYRILLRFLMDEALMSANRLTIHPLGNKEIPQ
ncbi:3'-5' exonuclease family protein [Marinobacterium mangrovicola]|uniref:Excinuclease cho n=1 Tax=Marinobacterium mangrovicola TaxID=1476959 RepID=A0A4R1GNX4_9GAMM|nr:3'-5' exonuclease family protein [Marinobacterium mangrovicola]TCK08635.1 DNA polymerase-3 subunit epsilon [Marinobacterium mangrovicola]